MMRFSPFFSFFRKAIVDNVALIVVSLSRQILSPSSGALVLRWLLLKVGSAAFFCSL